MVMKSYYSIGEVAELLETNKETLRRWDKQGKLVAVREPVSNYRVYRHKDLLNLPEFQLKHGHEFDNHVSPNRDYHSIELFAGAGGLALGLEQAGLHCHLLNELDKNACDTLRHNRPNWNVLEGDIKEFSFCEFQGKVDVVTGGFPCQAFSYAGKKLGFEDTRGTLFYEFARVVKETQPAICVAENVRGLVNHNQGQTLQGIIDALDDIGYSVITPVQVLKAIYYHVPQKRERIFIVGIRKDLDQSYSYPHPSPKIYTLKDALKQGELFNSDVPESPGTSYPEKKKQVLELVPPGGYWRDLPLDVQKEYMQKSYYLGGGKTGMARRISWNEPSLTLTCSPAQKQTERCHPDETRPFTVREYARIQTFPDDWAFQGSMSSQYKQIGNAVPVNLAKEMGYSIIRYLNHINA